MGYIDYCRDCKYHWTLQCKPYSAECEKEKARILTERKDQKAQSKKIRYLQEADEVKVMCAGEAEHIADKIKFVRNIGKLASQTRAGVIEIEYKREGGEELAIIHYKGGHTRLINITADSYTAIVRDIFKYID